MRARQAEIAVVGGGLAGRVAALAVAATGADTVLFAPPAAGPDRRTTALLSGSVRVLDALGVWAALAPQSAPLVRLRLVDATRNLIRAPEVVFHASELGLEAFGFNVENEVLHAALAAAATRLANLRIEDQAIASLASDADGVTLRTADAELRARLVIAADGGNSFCRRAAGIEIDRREFPQVALTMNLRHSRPHGDTSTEFHTESGPFTLVPLPGMRSSLVWVLDPARADEMAALDDAALAREIERRAHSILGRMEVEGGRGRFPIFSGLARSFARGRVALVGEAAHILPPIGAQGLNLGIRDAAAIAQLVAVASDPGADPVLQAYEVERRPDAQARALAVELMNRSLLSDFLPVHAARSLGLRLAAGIGPLRRALMRGGLGGRYSPSASGG